MLGIARVPSPQKPPIVQTAVILLCIMLAVTHTDAGAVLRPEVNVVVISRRAVAPPGLQNALRALPEWSRSVSRVYKPYRQLIYV